ncbi:hypothetical protein EI94DRAFT_1712827 [Lactarius quietus]|nr:hypothetical protein EI94DRAFT_1712827 [Lactarius quietus]
MPTVLLIRITLGLALDIGNHLSSSFSDDLLHRWRYRLCTATRVSGISYLSIQDDLCFSSVAFRTRLLWFCEQ